MAMLRLVIASERMGSVIEIFLIRKGGSVSH